MQDAVSKEKSLLSNVPTNQPFYINTNFTFNQKYNFKDNYFPMQPFLKTSEFKITPGSSSRDSSISNLSLFSKSFWPTYGVDIRFTNYSCVKRLAMSPGVAKTFLNKRTDSSGNINNTVFAKVDYIVTGYEHFGGHVTGTGINDATVYAKILKVTVYNSNADAANGGKPISVYNCQ